MGRRLRTVIAVGNQKGGVGKTTNAVHVAAALGERGYRCLVIDLDPSAGATRHLGVPLQSFAGTPFRLQTKHASSLMWSFPSGTIGAPDPLSPYTCTMVASLLERGNDHDV